MTSPGGRLDKTLHMWGHLVLITGKTPQGRQGGVRCTCRHTSMAHRSNMDPSLPFQQWFTSVLNRPSPHIYIYTQEHSGLTHWGDLVGHHTPGSKSGSVAFWHAWLGGGSLKSSSWTSPDPLLRRNSLDGRVASTAVQRPYFEM